MLRHCVHILGVYLLLLILSIACSPYHCNTQAYYDFETISWQSQQDSIGGNHSDSCLLELYIEPNSYIGQLSSPSFDFVGTAYAYKCASNGSFGLSNKITALRIYSNQDFTTSYPANTDLSSYIEFAYWDPINSNRADDYVFEPLSDASLDKINQQAADTRLPFYFVINKTPDLSSEFQFTIELRREDGSLHSATSSKVTWL